MSEQEPQSSLDSLRDLVTRHGTVVMERCTAIMGVLNVTPDSFYDGGRRLEPEKAIADGVEMVAAGADIIDIGGESTRPGAPSVSEEEELGRILPVIRGLRRAIRAPISIDTYKSNVACAALGEGADIVNDISGLRFDPAMAAMIAEEGVPVVLMHMQGTPRTMQVEPRYGDVVREVRDFLASQISHALGKGIEPEKIIIDPGIGFGKTLDHNLSLLRNLPALATLGQPLLVGASRKTFIGKILNLAPDERLEGSLAAAVAAVLAGANMIRAHDVKETRRAVNMADAIRYRVEE
ncbi:MAG TPA: dihydropteroate synthase [Methylomirabilota bacterium]|nr:dihydropteroate synthase [Methylomirabilota bacterium]